MDYVRIPLKNVINIEKIITLYYFEFAPDYRTKGERHDFWEIVYVDSGELDIVAGDKKIHLCCGDMAFHRPDEFHSVICDGIHTANVFIVTFECRSAAMKYFAGKVIRVTPKTRELVASVIDEAARNFEIGKYPLESNTHPPVGGKQMLRLYLEMLMITLMRDGQNEADGRVIFVSERNFGDKLTSDIMEYLEENIYGNITLDDLCEHFHFGKSRLCALFKDATGDSVMHSYLGLKIREAKKLLMNKEGTVSEISGKLGFESPQYFARMFGKYTGMTPTQYRNSVAVKAGIQVKGQRRK